MLSTTDEWRIKDAQKSTENLIAIIQDKQNEIDRLKSEFGVVMPLKPFPSLFPLVGTKNFRGYDCGSFQALQSNKNSLNSTNSWGVEFSCCPEKFKEFLEVWIAECRKIDAENQGAITHNTALYTKVYKLISQFIPATITTHKYMRNKTKRIDVIAEWTNQLNHAIPLYSMLSTAEKEYEGYLRSLAEWEKSIAKAKAEEERQEVIKIKENERINTIAFLRVKYKLDANAEQEEILEYLIKSNKYLFLAHYLEKNRGDWNDGSDYAETGLELFDRQTTEDQEKTIDGEIIKEISSLIDNWGGDGRCFRDCTYNYSALYGMVPEELLADYQKIIVYDVG